MSDDLDPQARDRLAAIGKGLVAAVPLAGGLLAEIVSVAIPNLREQRIVAYLRLLAQRLEALEKVRLVDELAMSGNILLIEQGGMVAARVTHEEKVGQIAHLVARGISSDERRIAGQQRLLRLIDQIDDEQYLLLAEQAMFHLKEGANRVRVDRPRFTTYSEGWEARAPRTLFQAGEEELVRLGLLERQLRVTNGGPSIASDGRDFAYNTKISNLGLMLLEESGFEGLSLN